jgi:hypothetical protein
VAWQAHHATSATFCFLSIENTTRFLDLCCVGAATRFDTRPAAIADGEKWRQGRGGEGRRPAAFSQFGPRHVLVNEGVLVGDDLESHPLYQLAKTSTGEQ